MQALRRVAALASRPATIRSALPFALMLGGWVAADLNPDVASEPPSGFALFFRVSTWACVALCVLGSCAGLSRVGSLPALPAGARFVFFEPATSSASYRADARPRPAWLAGSVVSRETAIQQARVARVVFGAWDEKGGALSLGYALHRDSRLYAPFIVEHHPLPGSSELLKEYFAKKRIRR